MDFKTKIKLLGRLYKILEKTGLKSHFPLDSFIDNYSPQLVFKLQSYCNSGKVAICSTNGKKTLLNIFNQILKQDNKTFITNLIKNKKYSFLSSTVLNLSEENSFSNEFKDYYTMIFDEFELANCFNNSRFDYLVLHNLFIDQKDYATLGEKRQKIQEALILNSKLNLVINADEPCFFEIDDIKNDVLLNKKRNKIFYGFNNIEFFNTNDILEQKNDFLRCPKCACILDYKKRFYSHIGYYECECGFKRPQLQISADAKIYPDYSFLNVYYNENKYAFKVPLGGVYNAYNALGAIALALSLKIERKIISKAFENYIPLKGRDEIIQNNGRNIKIKTIVNPTSLSEAIRELWGEKNVKVVFCLSDASKDGVDTSWIWDSNFKAFEGFENKIYVSSNRFDDLALRLKYANVNPCLISMDSSIKSAIQCCFWELEKNEKMLILTTPSDLDEVYRSIKK